MLSVSPLFFKSNSFDFVFPMGKILWKRLVATVAAWAALGTFSVFAPDHQLGAQDVWYQLDFSDLTDERKRWDGSVGFGLNGTGGNSQNVDINLSVETQRETADGVTDFLFNYFYSESDLVPSTDRIFSKARHEHKLANPNLNWYYSGTWEWDRFTGYDFRIALHTGAGWLLCRDDVRSLKTRFGAGSSREIGGVQDDWPLELQWGLDWERKLGSKTRLFATNDYYPQFKDFARFRVNTRAGLETVLDPAYGLSLQTFVLNRYNSTPNPGFQANDIDYGVSLGFNF